MDFKSIEYAEINLIGIVILFIMFTHMITTQKLFNRGANKYFTSMLVCNIIILATDTVIYFLRWKSAAIWLFLSNVMAVIFFITTVTTGYLWLMYTLKRLYPKLTLSIRKRILLLIPCFLCWIVIISSPWTKLIFYFTEQNRYMRGSFMWLTMFVILSYALISVIITIREMADPEYERIQSVYLTLLLFPLPAVIGSFVQLKFYGLTVEWICTAIALMTVFIDMQNIQISRDMLTGLFNRREIDKHIELELKKLNSAHHKLFVMMIDVDHFKQINDSYGHLIGDKALTDVSNILIKSFRTRDFIGRFGGDEFIVIGRLKIDEPIDHLIEKIHNNLNLFNENTGCHKISLSIGYVIYDSAIGLTTDRLIADADKQMYLTKNNKHHDPAT